MELISPAFEPNGRIPSEYTCEGENISVPLKIEGAPHKTVSFALVMDDPDAPNGTFDHWIAWNIPGSLKELPSGFSPPAQGVNGFDETGYRGPCPPPGKPHHYHIKIYALDAMINLPKTTTKADLMKAILGHVISQAEVVGVFSR